MMKGVFTELLEQKDEAPKLREEDPRYLLLQRILATADFERSPQLSRFLLYICTAAFEDRGHQLSELHIGVVVFGRKPDYDSAADTIVRSHALRLRRRLEQYFQKAGQNEPLRLIIPKGSYVPVFLADDDLTPDAEAFSTPATPQSSEDRGTGIEDTSSHRDYERHMPESTREPSPVPPTAVIWRYRFLTSLLLLLSVGLCVAFGLHLRTHFKMSRRHILWGQLFTENEPTEIVLGDSGLVLFHAVTKQYVSLHDYLSNDYAKQLPFVEQVDAKFAEFLLHRRYTSFVDATTLSHLVRLPEAIPERTLVHYSRDIHIDDFSSDNVIMIGAQEAVPWVELFEKHMDFVFSIDHPDKHSSFVNRNPRPGELKEYSPDKPSTANRVYGVIAFLPNLRGTGNVLILEGLSSLGTEAAINLALDDDRLLPLLQGIRRSDGTLPHFEMLLEGDSLGNGAGPARVVAIHLHD
jgi:hypothetical protein